MSNALAIAGVTAVMKDLLDSGMIDHKVTDAMGKGVTISATAPDNIELTGVNATPRLNLFLHQVTPNTAWRNVDLPSLDSEGNRTGNPPLALDLHYLLTAYGYEDLQAEVLLGYAMQLFHETPVLVRDAIRKSLTPSPVNGTILPSIYQALRASDLAEQVELIKITPASLTTEEMSRLWSALQAHYRPTASYSVSVVLIDPRRPARTPLPVLTRGKVDPVTHRERGVQVDASLIPAIPMLDSIEPEGRQTVAQLGTNVTVRGHHLDGSQLSVLLINERFHVEQHVTTFVSRSDTLIELAIPNSPAVLPVGVYAIVAQMMRPGETQLRTTNQMPLMIAPQITTPFPIGVSRAADGAATINLDCHPAVRPEQVVSLLLGEREIHAEPFTVPASALSFRVTQPLVGIKQLARLRVDGIETPIVNRSVKPPTFFDRRITIT